jgi:transposase
MALSVDLRERVLAAHERREGSQRVLAERFGVAVGTVNRWLRQAHAGRRVPLRPRGGRAALAGAGREDLAVMLAERVGRRFSPAVLCRALRCAGLRRKKKPCTRANKNGPMLRPLGPIGGRRSWSRSIPIGSSFSTRAGSTRA